MRSVNSAFKYAQCERAGSDPKTRTCWILFRIAPTSAFVAKVHAPVSISVNAENNSPES